MSRRNTTMKKRGGFNESGELWSFMVCKSLIDMAGLKPPAGTKKSHRKCLDFLAKKVHMSTEDLFNKTTPLEFIIKIGKRWDLLDQYMTRYGKIGSRRAEVPSEWHRVRDYRDEALKAGKKWGEDFRLKISELPEMNKSATRKSVTKNSSGNSSGN